VRLRWLIWVSGIALLMIAWTKGEIIEAGIAFSLGVSIGFFINWLGMRKFRFWDYPRQPFLGRRYFLITLPDWGLIGMIINLLWNWVETPWLAFPVVAIALFLTHDLPNLKTKSWNYYVPKWLAVLGWLLAILGFRVIFVAVS